MTVSKFVQTDFTTQDSATYKGSIDANFAVLKRMGGNFAPRAQDTPNMTVRLDAGHVFTGVTLTEKAAQNTGTITAPVGNPRIDRVVLDKITGVASIVTGTPAGSPAAPAIPTGKYPVCQILLQTSSASITNSMITDERNFGGGVSSFTTEASVASASTCDIGSAASNMILVTGTTTITSLGSSADAGNPLYFVRFSGALTLTHNGTSLILPGAANIKTANGDAGVFEYLGSGNWKCLSYDRATGHPVSVVGAVSSIASAGTTDLGTATSNLVSITGTTTITSFGSTAVTANPLYFIRFTGALTLTHNGTSLILPGAANITTAAGDSALMEYLGSGNWRCLSYNKISGKAVITAVAQTDLPAGVLIARQIASYTANAALTTTIPLDNTIPQNTEGTEIVSDSITPKKVGNTIRVTFTGQLAVNVAGSAAIALFIDSVANALQATHGTWSAANYGGVLHMVYEYTAVDTSSHTFAVRAGPDGIATSIRFNGITSGRYFGGVAAARLIIEEFSS